VGDGDYRVNLPMQSRSSRYARGPIFSTTMNGPANCVLVYDQVPLLRNGVSAMRRSMTSCPVRNLSLMVSVVISFHSSLSHSDRFCGFNPDSESWVSPCLGGSCW